MTYCRFYIFFSKLSLACFLDFIMLTFTSVCIQDILYVPQFLYAFQMHLEVRFSTKCFVKFMKAEVF